MRKHLTFAAAAALAAGTAGWMGSSQWLWGEEPQPQGQAAGQAATTSLPPGIERSEAGDVTGIRKTLGLATEAAFTKDGCDDFLKHLTQVDRDRLEPYFKEHKDQLLVLNGRINQIRKIWKDKYNHEFDLKGKEEVVFGNQFQNFEIVQGEVTNPALLTIWPVTPTTEQQQPQPGQRMQQHMDQMQQQMQRDMRGEGDARIGQGQAGQPAQAMAGTAQLEKGETVAVVHYPSEGSLPELNVSLVREKDKKWLIDVPDTLSGEQFYQQLLNHLTVFGEHTDEWPQDVNQAYRHASRHAMMAAYNVSAPPMTPQPGQQQQQPDGGYNR